jgi:ribosome-binding protein aMBF1 (putative translation factor)
MAGVNMDQVKRVYVRRDAPLSEEQRTEYAERIMGLREKYRITQQMIADEMKTSRTPIIFAQRGKLKSREPYQRVLGAIKVIATRQELASIGA